MNRPQGYIPQFNLGVQRARIGPRSICTLPGVNLRPQERDRFCGGELTFRYQSLGRSGRSAAASRNAPASFPRGSCIRRHPARMPCPVLTKLAAVGDGAQTP
jgi:hypothetical protein